MTHSGAQRVPTRSWASLPGDDHTALELPESVHGAVIQIDAEGRVVAWDRAAEATLGWSAAEAVGQPMAELILPERFREALHRGLRRYLDAGQTGVSDQRLELAALHRDGHELQIELMVSPIRVGGATVFNAFVHGVTDHRRAERETHRLAAIVETSEDAIVSGSFDGTVLTWNAGAERIYGYSAEEMIGQSITRLRPSGDYSEVAEVRERLASGHPVRDFETREVHRDGHLVDVSVSMTPLRDESGEVVGVASIARDISERKADQRALAEARERFRGAFDHAPIGMALVDLDGYFVSVNRAFCELTARSEEEMTSISFRTVTHPDDVDSDDDLVRRALEGEIDRYELEKRYLRPDGSVVWGSLAVSLVRGPDAEPLHFIRQIQDVTARKEAEENLRRHSEHLRELALRDSLTGLGNDRNFHATLDRELQRARRHGGELSVVVFEVDRVGGVNRERGGSEGDRLLRAVGQVVGESCRRSDLTARLGGDEFALILPETDAVGAEDAARRVVRAVGAQVEDRVSLSHGLASCPADGDSGELLLRRAELALGLAKPGSTRSRDEELGLPSSVSERIERILGLVREQLGMDVAFLGEMVDGREVFQAMDGDAAAFGVDPGVELPLSDSYCQALIEGRIPNVVPDTRLEPEIADLPVTRERGIGAYVGVPVYLPDGRIYGALCGVSSEPRPGLSEADGELLRFLAALVEELLDHAGVEEHERRTQVELSGVHALVAALEARDHYTGEHSRTVVGLSAAVAERLALSVEKLLEVEQVAILHDIGKVGIPDAVLQKRGPLTAEEWALMREHPAVGERIVAGLESLSHLASAVRAEHERFDGDGYPDGLKGEEIPIASRITFACDAYHAMTSDRPYRAAMPEDRARAELEANAGTQFDPLVVRALSAAMDER